MMPALIGLSATQINIAVDTHLASRFGNGPVSYLNYAFRLIQLPIGLFGVAIATSTLAAVSFHAARKNVEKLCDTVRRSLRLAACLTLPAAAGLILFRHEIVALLYQRGQFMAGDTLKTSYVLLFYSLALFAYSAVKILVPTFYALNDTATPVRLSVATVGVKVCMNFILIVPLGFTGLALATAVAAWFNFILLAWRFAVRTGVRWHWAEVWIYGRILCASLITGLMALVVYRGAVSVAPAGGTPGLALHLGAAIAAAIAGIVPLLRLFGIEEANALASRLWRLKS